MALSSTPSLALALLALSLMKSGRLISGVPQAVNMAQVEVHEAGEQKRGDLFDNKLHSLTARPTLG